MKQRRNDNNEVPNERNFKSNAGKIIFAAKITKLPNRLSTMAIECQDIKQKVVLILYLKGRNWRQYRTMSHMA